MVALPLLPAGLLALHERGLLPNTGPLSLPHLAGELRVQALMGPSAGAPPFLLAKGPEAGGFRAGTPLVVWGPKLPGFTRYMGAGLWGQPGTPCSESLK